MKKIYLLIILGLLYGQIGFAQSADCTSPLPACFAAGSISFSASTSSSGYGAIGCLGSTPNPAWYYVQVATPGSMYINMASSGGEDIDFAVMGPYANLAAATAACPTMESGGATPVACSYSTSGTENATFTTTTTGQVYMVLLTNYSNASTNVTFGQTGGTGTTDCTIANCNIDGVVPSTMTPTCNDNGTASPLDDYVVLDLTVNVTSSPTTGTLNLTGAVTASLPATGASSYTFTSIQLPSVGASQTVNIGFSAVPACSQSITIPASSLQPCSVAACSISSVTATNASTCNDAGTSDIADDTYTVDVVVNFVNPPATGTLDLAGSGTASVAVGSLSSSTTHTFSGVVLPADGGTSSLSATFSADAACTFTNSSITNPVSCSCVMTTVAAVEGTCNNNGTPGDASDDYYTYTVTVSYTNPPTSGTLDLVATGFSFASGSTTSTIAYGLTTAIFNVNIPANASGTIDAAFSAKPFCTSGTTVTASASTCALVSWNLIISDPCVCNNDATIAGNDGTFHETIMVLDDKNENGVLDAGEGLPSGQTYTLVSPSVGLNGVPMGTVLTETVVSGETVYTLSFNHTEAIGYTAYVEGSAASGDPANVVQVIGATCNYPNPEIMCAPADICFNASPVQLSGSQPHGPNTASPAWTGSGIDAFGLFDPTLVAIGTYVINYDYDPAGDGNWQCLQPVETSINVIDCPLPACNILGVLISQKCCDNNGNADPSDDFYEADITILYVNAPTGVALEVTDGVSVLASAVPASGSNYHVFTINLPANNTAINITAQFSGTICNDTAIAPAVAPCTTTPACTDHNGTW